MIDLLAANGTIEILIYLSKLDAPIKIPVLNEDLLNQKKKLTTATIYRRVKELELIGFIEKDRFNGIKITEKGLEALSSTSNRGRANQEFKLKRSRREILSTIDQHRGISVTELQQQGFSPNTVQQSIKELEKIDLVMTEQVASSSIFSSMKKEKAGRPKKKLKITKKAKEYLTKQEELEKNLK